MGDLQLPPLLAGEVSAKAKQHAMVTLGTLTALYGDKQPAAILTALPAILAEVRYFHVLNSMWL